MRFAQSLSLMVMCGVLAACGGGSTGGANPPIANTSPTLAVALNQPFTDTGVALTAGETRTITAAGTLHNGQCTTTCDFSPAGKPWSFCSSDPGAPFAAPGLPCWSLIGKIGQNGTPFEIGDSLTLIAATSGELFIGSNDNYFPDNSGSWTVSVTP